MRCHRIIEETDLCSRAGFLEHALVREAPSPLQLAALEALLEAAAAQPDAFAARYSGRLPWLRGFLSHTDVAGDRHSIR